MRVYDDLKYRGLIKDEAGDIEDVLNNQKITFYWGTDPTADSLHIGHLSSILTAKRLASYGHNPILLIGGATGLIGDPRPTAEREIISRQTVLHNAENIKSQVSRMFDDNIMIVNNYDWTKNLDLISFLRDTGKYININYMLDKDIIRRRLDSGITFAEFTYTLMQGYDFLHLFETQNCIMQVAGSDQWGNITTGVDLIKKKTAKEAYAFTMPLVLDQNGNKIGKSEGNAIWLDINKTSAYEMYQYFLNSDDSMVISYLKIYTFLNKEEIDKIEKKHLSNPEERLAQKTLASEIVKFLHGKEECDKAIKISNCLFGGNICNLNKNEILEGFKGVPSFEITDNLNIVDFLVESQIVSSKRQAREFISSGTITINDKKITDESIVVNRDMAIEKEIFVVKRGKKKYYIGVIKK